MNAIELHSPWFLLLAALAPLSVLVGGWRRRRSRADAAIRFSNVSALRGIRPTARLRLRFFTPLLRVAVLALLAAALARPQRGSEIAPEHSEGISIVMAVDISNSMTTPDFKIDGKDVSRLEATKKVFRDFVKGTGGLKGRPQDEIGIVTFAGYAVPAAPATLDHGVLVEILDRMKTFALPDDRRKLRGMDQEMLQEETSTALGDGLAMAVSHVKDLKTKSKVIILMSDGAQTTGILQPEEGAALARDLGIKIYSIGIGQAGIVLRKMTDAFGFERLQRVQSDLDEETLKAVAETTGGKYFNAATTDALTDVYGAIDALERSKIESQRYYRYDERFQAIALAALGLLVLEVILSQTFLRRIP